MSGFGSNSSALLHAKGDWRAERATRDADRQKLIRLEHAKVIKRAGGQCEVRIVMTGWRGGEFQIKSSRCQRRAVHDHHRFGGNGRRNRGQSIYAENRLAVCQTCHNDEGAKRLRPVSWDESDWASTVVWEHCR